MYDRPFIAHMLIVRGEASPQQRVPITGNVPLHLAAEQGHIETVKVNYYFLVLTVFLLQNLKFNSKSQFIA